MHLIDEDCLGLSGAVMNVASSSTVAARRPSGTEGYSFCSRLEILLFSQKRLRMSGWALGNGQCGAAVVLYWDDGIWPVGFPR